MKTLFAFHFTILILQGMVGSSVAKCPDRYVELGTGCYHFSVQENITWYQAYFICHVELHGYLVEIENQQEQNNIRQHIETTADPEGKYGFWLGATDILEENEYRWMTSGNLLTFNMWYPNEPNNLNRDEGCVMFFKDIDYMWNDLRCNNLIYPVMKAICETSQT